MIISTTRESDTWKPYNWNNLALETHKNPKNYKSKTQLPNVWKIKNPGGMMLVKITTKDVFISNVLQASFWAGRYVLKLHTAYTLSIFKPDYVKINQ